MVVLYVFDALFHFDSSNDIDTNGKVDQSAKKVTIRTMRNCVLAAILLLSPGIYL